MDLQAVPTLSVRGLKKTSKHKRVLEGLYLDIYPGEVVFLLGSKNSGKSCLLNIVAGFDSPSGGDVFFENTKITNDWISSGKLLHIKSQGKQHLYGRLGQRITGWQNKSGQSHDNDLLSLVGLKDDEKTLCRQLSQEKRQRFSLAQALALLPKLLLVDAAMDDLPRADRRRILDSLAQSAHQSGMAVLYASRHAEDALAFGDRTAILAKGRIMQNDTPKTVYEEPNSAACAKLSGECILLEGTATAVKDETVFVDIDGLGFTCFSKNWISPGDPLLLCLRPDQIFWGIKADRDYPIYLHAILREQREVPEGFKFTFELRNGTLLSFTRSNPPTLPLHVNDGCLLWFDTKHSPLLAYQSSMTEDEN